ncbi:TonB-dependent receptor [Myroides sp. LJL116]
MKLQFAIGTFLACITSIAQNGNVKGTLKDYQNQEPLAFASVIVQQTNQGFTTDIDGNYSFDLSPGNYDLTFQYVGYNSEQKTIQVEPEKTITIDMELLDDSTQLEDVVLIATRSRANESTLLLDQQRSAQIQQHIGSQELAKKGVSDAAGAVVKTTGVSKQEGSGTIFVRGLGDRYNSTYYNAMPLSSDDPEKKNINLSIFNTDIIEYISIDKTYNVSSYGDFAGGNIDINSKKHNAAPYLQVSMGSNINTNATGHTPFKVLSGRDYFGFSNNNMPKNALSSYKFTHSTQTKSQDPIGASLGLNTGKTFYFGQSTLNLFATASFSNDYKYRQGVSRTAQAQDIFTKDLNLQSYQYSTNTTAMFNADFDYNPNNSIKYNFLFINDSQEKNDLYNGYIVDVTPDRQESETLIQRQQYKQNRLFVNQLLGSHTITDQIQVNWGASANDVSSRTPDRQQYMLNQVIGKEQYVFATNARSNNNRYFENLSEREYAASLAVDYKFALDDDQNYKAKLTLGYNGRTKDRKFQATQYVFGINNAYNNNIDPNNLDAFFNQANFSQGYFDIYTFRGGSTTPNALKPQTYEGKLDIQAGFVNLQYQLSPRLTGVLGVRFETISQKVTWQTQLDSKTTSDKLDKNAVLPALHLKYALTDLQNLRLAMSKTYTLPQFKERARFIYEDVTEIKVGNPDVYASDDYNLDLKWEFFPKNDEVFAITAFGKYIKNPINEIVMASSSNDITYANTGDYGVAYGAEIEIKKDIIHFSDVQTNKLSAGLNASIMKTYQKLDNEKVNRENRYINTLFTHKSSAFTGASDLLLNADVTYTKQWEESSFLATLSYAHFSDKLQSIGTEGSGNLVDKAFGVLDFNAKYQWNKHFAIGLSAKNLLDPKIQRKQENLTKDLLVQSYKLGQNISLSLSYKF